MTKREVAVVPANIPGQGWAMNDAERTIPRFRIKARQRVWFLFWGAWRTMVVHDRVEADYEYKDARRIADQVLANGFVPGTCPREAYPIVELDEEGL